MKKLLSLLTGILYSLSLFSQIGDDEYEELLILKADQNWEKLITQSEKLTEKNKTKNDPVPYYYLAYGLYKISFLGARPEEYKNAYKDALTAVGKMGRKDDDGKVLEEYDEFFNELKYSLLEIIKNEIDAGEYRRAFGWVMKIYKFGRDHIGGKYLEGAVRYRNGDKATARTKWKEAAQLLDELESTDDWMEADRDFIKLGMYESAKCQIEARQMDAAKEIMNLGHKYFEEDEDWKRWYDEIVNG
jgi:hypothetical protein